MKPALVDTDILSGFLRGTETVVQNVSEYLNSYDAVNFTIITYHEILNGLCLGQVLGLHRFMLRRR